MSDDEIRNIWYFLFPFKKMTEQDMKFARKLIDNLLQLVAVKP